MASTKIQLQFYTSDSKASALGVMQQAPTDRMGLFQKLAALPGSGTEIRILNSDAVAATGTLTFSSTASNNDTTVINGITFTAKTSGATGNQYNIGASATASATNLTAAINTSTTTLIAGSLYATSAAGVVTLNAIPGLVGNYMTVAVGVDSGSVCAASGARLTGGLEDTSVSKSARAYKA